MPNEEQSEYWNEKAGPKWVDAQAMLDATLNAFTAGLLDGARLEPGHAVLDVGCGTGQTTVDIFRRVSPGGSVLGLDLSAVMLEAAGARAAQAGTSPSFRQADAQVATFDGASFDRIMSRLGVMFFDDPVAAFANLRSATRAGGSLTFLCWQSPRENPWVALPMSIASRFIEIPRPEAGAPGPFAFADPDHVRGILEKAGWADVSIESRTGSMIFADGSIEGALLFLQKIGPLSRLVAEIESEDVRDQLLQALRGAFEEAARDAPDGKLALGAATWLVSATCPA